MTPSAKNAKRGQAFTGSRREDAQGIERELLALCPAWTSCTRSEVRKHRGKHIAVYELVSHANAGGRQPQPTDKVVVKFYGSDRGRKSHVTLVKLWHAGFRPPSDFRVPHSYGYMPERAALVQSQAPGAQWADLLGSDSAQLREASTAAAEWLLALRQVDVDAEAVGPDRSAADARRFVAELTSAFPNSVASLADLGERLIRQLRSGTISLVPSHGDFHPENVFLSDGTTTVIDFDRFGLREPASDVGYAIGQLLIMSWFRFGSFGPGVEAASTFVARRQSEDKNCPWNRVALNIALTLLQSLHYELCTLGNGRTELLELWPNLMEHWLTGNTLEALEHPLRSR